MIDWRGMVAAAVLTLFAIPASATCRVGFSDATPLSGGTNYVIEATTATFSQFGISRSLGENIVLVGNGVTGGTVAPASVVVEVERTLGGEFQPTSLEFHWALTVLERSGSFFPVLEMAYAQGRRPVLEFFSGNDFIASLKLTPELIAGQARSIVFGAEVASRLHSTLMQPDAFIMRLVINGEMMSATVFGAGAYPGFVNGTLIPEMDRLLQSRPTGIC